MSKILVTGASGFIGHHLVRFLKKKGHLVRGVDWKDYNYNDADDFKLLDLRNFDSALVATKDVDEVYALASDMGGAGYINNTKNQASMLKNNILIEFNTLEAAKLNRVKRYLLTSSACVYPKYRQTKENSRPLKEDEVYPADPENSYGWAKLTAEKLCELYREFLDTKIVRFQNIYGPEDVTGERAKAPMAICEKVAKAIRDGKSYIDIWGEK